MAKKLKQASLSGLSHQALFVTGTDTGVGKTLIAAALARGIKDFDQKWTYWKPIQTGLPDNDLTAVRDLVEADLNYIPSLFLYQKPASPNQAAKAENRPAPDLLKLNQVLNQHLTSDQASPLLIEGAGGLLVPLNDDYETWLDWLKLIRIPILVVARTSLGTLNHTAMTLRELQNERLFIQGVVLNGPIHRENLQTLQSWFTDIPFYHFPQLENIHNEDPQWLQQSRLLARWYQNQLAEPYQTYNDRDWLKSDRKHCWHPYTQHKLNPAALPIVRAKGVWLEDLDGNRYIDGTSSWWTNTIGHGHPAIRTAISEQQARLDHVLFAGVTHRPASQLSQKLSELSEHQLPRVFFSDNGSCAVEVALKIALQSWTNKGITNKRKILSFRGSYHGDTFGTMAVAAADNFHAAFRDLMFQPLLATPATTHPSFYNREGSTSLDQRLQELHACFEKHHSELACVIIEPKVQGSSGMNIQHDAWIQTLDQLCEHYKIPLILDEVFTGMGRFGAPFVFQRLGLNPSIVCIAKGLTGGNLALAATLCKEELFQDFYDDERSKALYHGHTYTANPIACAAALATLEVYEAEDCVAASLRLEKKFREWLDLHSFPLGLENPRCYGSLMAWELPASGVGNYYHPLAARIPQLALLHGLLLRPLGNTVYFLPALNIKDEELNLAFQALEKLMREMKKDFIE